MDCIKKKKTPNGSEKNLSTFLQIDVLEVDISSAHDYTSQGVTPCVPVPGDPWLDVWIVFLGFCFADGKKVLSEVKTRLQGFKRGCDE